MRQLLIFLLLFSILNVSGQVRQSVGLELGKNGVIVNAVYDRMFLKSWSGFRAGVGSNFARYLRAFTISAGGYKLTGGINHFFETGLDVQYLNIEEISDDQRGFAFLKPAYSVSTLYPSLNLGYRGYLGRLVCRAGFAPGIIKKLFIPGAYISIGISW